MRIRKHFRVFREEETVVGESNMTFGWIFTRNYWEGCIFVGGLQGENKR
jgi:hypothetical protein